jgi:PBP1b-binding outer membrane lipoprotein LpoB
MKNVFKVLIISVLCMFLYSCKSNTNTTKEQKAERTDTTDDVRDDQMEDYEEEMRQQNN